jgi:PAS domain S-box-containing protein
VDACDDLTTDAAPVGEGPGNWECLPGAADCRADVLSSGVDAGDLIEALLDHSPLANYLVGPDGRIASWNRAAEDLLGYRADEIIGKSSSILMPMHFESRWGQARKNVAAQRTVNVESVRRRKDGGLVDVSLTATAIGHGASGTPYYVVTLRDKSRERAIEAENENLATLVRRSPLAIVSVDTDRRVRTWNAAADALFGFHQAEVVGRNIDMIVPEHLRQAALVQTDLLNEGQTVEFQTLRCARDGREIAVSLLGTPILNASGVATGLALYYRDVTNEVASRHRLEEAEAFSRSILEASQDWIVVLDETEGVLYCNQSVKSQLATEPAWPAVGSAWRDLWPRDQAAAIGRSIEEARSTGSARMSAMRLLPDGRKPWYDILLVKLNDTAHSRGRLLVIARDITTKKASDDQIAFIVKELSHRAKNLLAVILGMTRGMAEESQSVTQFKEAICSRIHGLACSHDLLTRQNWTSIDLHSLVRQHLRPFLDPTSARLTLEGENLHLGPAVAQALGLALHELATNAVKYGALSNASGHLHISSTKVADGYRFTWLEGGGPPVKPPRRRGFGSIVLEEMICESFGTSPVLDFAPSGLTWSMIIPLHALAPHSA